MGVLEDGRFDVHPQNLLQRVSSPCRFPRTLVADMTRGVPDERPIPDLPIERPDFQLLYGKQGGEEAKQAAIPSADGAMIGQRRTMEGGADVDVTDKLTMTWVSTLFIGSAAEPC